MPNQPILNLPPMTKALLALNVAIHVLRLLLPTRLNEALLVRLGFAPVRYVTIDWSSWPALVSPITYQFLHGGLGHLAANMLGLMAFGSGVEQRLGRWRFLVFYLVCGLTGALAQFAVNPDSARLLIGASGAISGLFGGILRLRADRRNFWLLVAAWLALNVMTGESGVIGAGNGPVAWVAHVGGFLAGLLLYPAFERRIGDKD
jgi:membrane associated rhomboid family serine protease